MLKILSGLSSVRGLIVRLAADARGVTSLEYGVIAAVTVVAVAAVIGTVGDKLTTIFTTIAGAL